MCLAIPMQIQRIDGLTAYCEARGSARQVSLFLLRNELPGVGDFVLVSMDRAVSQVTVEEAELSWQMFDQILAFNSGG
jgi:hydrogenase expression/formation protein HypC